MVLRVEFIRFLTGCPCKGTSLYLFTESEGQPAQMVLRVEFIGLLVGCRVAEEVHARALVVQLESQAHSEGDDLLSIRFTGITKFFLDPDPDLNVRWHHLLCRHTYG